MPDTYPLPRDLPIPPMDKASGYKDTAFTWAMGDLILARIWAGETMKAITADPRMPAYCTAVAAPGAPSVKTLYRRVETCPGFRVAFVDACDWRNGWLGFQAELVVDEAFAIGIPAANAKIARLKARRGRLTPKHYRTPPTSLTCG